MDGPATKTAPATKWAGVEAQQAINGPIRNTQLQPPTAVAGSQSAEASRLCSKWAAIESPGQPITRKHPDVDDDVAIKNTFSIRIVVRKRINLSYFS